MSHFGIFISREWECDPHTFFFNQKLALSYNRLQNPVVVHSSATSPAEIIVMLLS